MPHDHTAFSSRTVEADKSAVSSLAPVYQSARVKLGHSVFVQPGHSFSRAEHAERMRALNASHARLTLAYSYHSYRPMHLIRQNCE